MTCLKEMIKFPMFRQEILEIPEQTIVSPKKLYFRHENLEVLSKKSELSKRSSRVSQGFCTKKKEPFKSHEKFISN